MITRIGARTAVVVLPDGRRGTVSLGAGGLAWVTAGGVTVDLGTSPAKTTAIAHAPPVAGPRVVIAPVTGRVLRVHVVDGAVVDPHAPLVTLESMKMEITIAADRAGTIDGCGLAIGQSVARGERLLTIV